VDSEGRKLYPSFFGETILIDIAIGANTGVNFGVPRKATVVGLKGKIVK
jgi:serine acetyltransferase